MPLAETGERAVELLLKAIAGEPVPEKPSLLPVELIVRESSGGESGGRCDGDTASEQGRQ